MNRSLAAFMAVKPAGRVKARTNARQVMWCYASVAIVSQLVFFLALATMTDWGSRVGEILKQSAQSEQALTRQPSHLRRSAKYTLAIIGQTHSRPPPFSLDAAKCGLEASGQMPVSQGFRGESLGLHDMVAADVNTGKYLTYHVCLSTPSRSSKLEVSVNVKLTTQVGNADLFVSFSNPNPGLTSSDFISQKPGGQKDKLFLDANVPDWPLTQEVHIYIGVLGRATTGISTFKLEVATSLGAATV
jgi:hypothetical protein